MNDSNSTESICFDTVTHFITWQAVEDDGTTENTPSASVQSTSDHEHVSTVYMYKLK